jgi:hypothetical protein
MPGPRYFDEGLATMVEVNLQLEDYALELVVIVDLYDAVLAHHRCRDPAPRGASPLVENAQYVARLDHFWVRVRRAVIDGDERQKVFTRHRGVTPFGTRQPALP